MNKEVLSDRINSCIDLAKEFKRKRMLPSSGDISAETLYGKWFSQATVCLIDIFGKDHLYSVNFQNTCGSIQFPSIDQGIGILTAAKEDIDSGYLNGLFGLISAEIFSDVLEMAEHFLKENYKDPAAIIIGIALESHLRFLCKKNNISYEFEKEGNIKYKKASTLNNELTKASVYSKLDEKTITAWLDLRNNAAHGKFDGYSLEQVNSMLLSVTDFINRTK